MTQTAQTGVAVDNLDSFSDDNIPEDRKEGEDGWKGGFAVDDEEGDVVDLEAIGEISDAGSAFVGMRDDDDFVAAVYEFLGDDKVSREAIGE